MERNLFRVVLVGEVGVCVDPEGRVGLLQELQERLDQVHELGPERAERRRIRIREHGERIRRRDMYVLIQSDVGERRVEAEHGGDEVGHERRIAGGVHLVAHGDPRDPRGRVVGLHVRRDPLGGLAGVGDERHRVVGDGDDDVDV